jgi:hypothetical protein
MSSPFVPVALVTDEEARLHLRVDEVPTTPTDLLLVMKILQASEIVTDYIKVYEHDWTSSSAPPLIKAAVLLVLTMLYDHPSEDPLTAGVKNILHRYRDPTLA